MQRIAGAFNPSNFSTSHAGRKMQPAIVDCAKKQGKEKKPELILVSRVSQQ